MTGNDVRPAAERVFKESQDQLGREHPETVWAADTWAQVVGNVPKRIELLRENVEIQRRRFGAEHELALGAVDQLVICLGSSPVAAELDEAESLARESCEIWVRRAGRERIVTLSALKEFGDILAKRGKLHEARSVFAALPDGYARVFGPDHFRRGVVLHHYGLLLEATGDLDGAEAQYRRSLAIQSKGLAGRKDRQGIEAKLHVCLARLELTRGRDADAVKLLLPILDAHAKTQTLPVAADRFPSALADALAERGDPKAAIELLKAVHNDAASSTTELGADSIGSCLISRA